MAEIPLEQLNQDLDKIPAAKHEAYLKDLKAAGYTWKSPEESSAWDKKLPGLTQLSEGIGKVADVAQAGADKMAEVGGRVAASRPGAAALKAFGNATGVQVDPTTAGAMAGAPLAAASTGIEFAKGMVPTTPKDIALMIGLEGAGALGRAANKTKLGGKILSKVNPDLGKVGEAVSKLPGVEPVIEAIKATVPKGKEALRQAADAVSAQAEAVAAATRQGITNLLPAQITGSPSFAMLERLVGRSPMLSDQLYGRYAEQSKALSDASYRLLDNLGPAPAPSEAGRVLKEDLNTRIENLQKGRESIYQRRYGETVGSYPAPALPEGKGALVAAEEGTIKGRKLAYRKKLYDKAWELVPDNQNAVLKAPEFQKAGLAQKEKYGEEIKSLREKSYSIATEAAAGPSGASIPNPLSPPYPKDVADKMIEQYRKDPKLILRQDPSLVKKVQAYISQGEGGTYRLEELQNKIHILGEKAQNDRLENGDYGPDGKVYNQLKLALQRDVDAFMDLQAPQAKEAYDIAKAFHGDYAEIHRNKTILDLYKKNPRLVFESIVKGGDEEATDRLIKAIGGNGRDVVKRQMMEDIFGDGSTLPKKVDVKKRLAELGPVIRRILSKPEQKMVENFAKLDETPPFVQSFYEERVRDLLKHDPKQLVDQVLSGDAAILKAVKKYTSPVNFNMYRQLFAQKVFMNNTNRLELGSDGILKRLQPFLLDKEFLPTLYDQKTIQGMQDLGKASQLLHGYEDLSRRVINGKDGSFMLGAQGAVINPGVSKLGIFLINASGLGKLYLSDWGRRAITTLQRMPQGDPRFPQTLARLAQLGVLQHPAQRAAEASAAIQGTPQVEGQNGKR